MRPTNSCCPRGAPEARPVAARLGIDVLARGLRGGLSRAQDEAFYAVVRAYSMPETGSTAVTRQVEKRQARLKNDKLG